jgi:thiol:disulfide interchange protein DsbD
MIAKLSLISAMLCTITMAGQGGATAGWLAESATCVPGKPLKTAIRMIHDPGWHSYWINPGEAGMKTSAEWKLPPGWTSGGLGFPAPKRFLTSDLAGFGYEDAVLFPVTVTPPADFTGKARLTVVISWLACGEEGCVPGKAEVHLDLTAGTMAPTSDSRAIHDACRLIPNPAMDFPRLTVTEKDKSLILVIETKPGAALNLDGREFFPATPEVIDPRVPIRFKKQDGVWTTEVAKSEYARSPVKQLTLVLAAKKGNGALEVKWSAP